MRIAIEGNIGSGKTTQLDMISTLGIPVYKEPVHLWPLEEFYQDPERNAFLMQTTVLTTFPDQGTGVYERSTLASRMVFSNLKNPQEVLTYGMLYNRIGWNPDFWIFLESSPELCHRRVQRRNGPGDSKVSLEYLEKLDQRYRDMYEHVKSRAFVVNADRPASEVFKTIMAIINEHCSGYPDSLIRSTPDSEH